MIGYDNNSDDDIDDARDDVIMNENFNSKAVSFTYDDAGNLIDDGTFVYIYDAWNRLVKVRASDASDITIQESEFDGMGRRIKKVVSNSGEYDGTWIYLFDGLKIIETRDGSNNLVQQFIHGNEYIDELVMVRVEDKGELYIHQDANWNVIALTDLGGHVVERYLYKPYGEMIVNQETGFGDYDGDQDVDTTDRDAYSGSSPSGAERILDLDFDGDVDGTDTTLFNSNLVTGISRHPGRISTGVEQPYGHQGLLFDSEISSYQNRYRQYASLYRRFMQWDPLGYAGGLNSYGYNKDDPLAKLDPLAMIEYGMDSSWMKKTCVASWTQFISNQGKTPWNGIAYLDEGSNNKAIPGIYYLNFQKPCKFSLYNGINPEGPGKHGGHWSWLLWHGHDGEPPLQWVKKAGFTALYPRYKHHEDFFGSFDPQGQSEVRYEKDFFVPCGWKYTYWVSIEPWMGVKYSKPSEITKFYFKLYYKLILICKKHPKDLIEDLETLDFGPVPP